MIVRCAVKRSCLAFVFRLGGGRAAFYVPRVINSCALAASTCLFSSSSFTPPEPPKSKGMPVYPDIDFSLRKQADSESFRRNADIDAVFVVNGASRGIGLQFVKSLVERTKVGVIICYSG